jgi:hypothetical protein
MNEFPDEMMDHAFELATEWGPNFRKPIHDRIRLRYPDLTDDQIDRLKAIADEAESYIVHLGEEELEGRIREGDIIRLASERYPWASAVQVSRLKNIAMYWARK